MAKDINSFQTRRDKVPTINPIHPKLHNTFHRKGAKGIQVVVCYLNSKGSFIPYDKLWEDDKPKNTPVKIITRTITTNRNYGN